MIKRAFARVMTSFIVAAFGLIALIAICWPVILVVVVAHFVFKFW